MTSRSQSSSTLLIAQIVKASYLHEGKGGGRSVCKRNTCFQKEVASYASKNDRARHNTSVILSLVNNFSANETERLVSRGGGGDRHRETEMYRKGEHSIL